MRIPHLVMMTGLLLAGGSALTAHGQEVTLPPREQVHLFVLAGQSNMAGRGVVDEEGRRTNPRIFSLRQEGAWRLASDPLHWDKKAAGAGLGKPFAEILARRLPEVSIGLVPTACGGSPISTWVPGGYWEQTRSHPYDDFLTRTRAAMQAGTLKAILWHQGESDANATDAPKYEERLTALIARMRADLGAPELPFILGQLGRFADQPWTPEREMVDAAQRNVATKVPRVRFVTAEGMSAGPDHVHFDTASLRLFAERYAAAYMEMASAAR